MQTTSPLLLLLMCLACASSVRAQLCAGTGCSGCTGESGCGWCTVLGAGTSTSFSQCAAGSVMGPSVSSGVVCDVAAGSVWHFGDSSTSACGDQCNSYCGSMCSGDQWCQINWYSTQNYQCACNENAFAVLGMALLTAVLVITFASIAVCVGISICCYYLLRAPRYYPQQHAVIVSQPYMMAPAYSPHGAHFSQQYAQPPPSQLYRQPLLNGNNSHV